jgi:hypothetical protein
VARAGVDGGATAEVKDVGDARGGSRDAEVLEVGDLVPIGKVERVGVDVRDRGEELAKVGSDGEGFIHRWAGRHGDNGGEEGGDLREIEARNVGLHKLHGEVKSLGLQARGGGDGGKRKEQEGRAVFLAAHRGGDVGGVGRHGGGQGGFVLVERSHVKTKNRKKSERKDRYDTE